MPDFPNIILFAIPFFILAMLVALYITTKQHIRTYEVKDAFSSIAMGLGNVFKDVFTGEKSIKNRILYFVKPPGWSHDGTGKISNDLRQGMANKKKYV